MNYKSIFVSIPLNNTPKGIRIESIIKYSAIDFIFCYFIFAIEKRGLENIYSPSRLHSDTLQLLVCVSSIYKLKLEPSKAQLKTAINKNPLHNPDYLSLGYLNPSRALHTDKIVNPMVRYPQIHLIIQYLQHVELESRDVMKFYIWQLCFDS